MSVQISDEAREYGINERALLYMPAGYHVQLAINSATEKLQQTIKEQGRGLLDASHRLSLAESARDKLRAELLATQAQVEQLKTAIKEASRILMREDYPSSASALQSTLSLTPATALAPIVEALKESEFILRFDARRDKHKLVWDALQLLGVKEAK